MKSIGAVFALTISAGALAYPMDIENDARWLVLDGLAMPAGLAQQETQISNLRARDLSGEAVGISAVCGIVDFRNDDEGATNFVVYYAAKSGGGIAAISPPFFYGTAAGGRSLDPDQRVAQEACDDDGRVAPPIAASR
jgi:hypothetical protein